LRNADDKRRHGSLGKRRMKEFRDAKRAMERDREERAGGVGGGVTPGSGFQGDNRDEEVRRGRGRPRGSANLRGTMGGNGQGGMRRHAILNNLKEGRGY
jgi:hypothetical protein